MPNKIKKETLKSLVEKHVQEAGENKLVGYDNAAEYVGDLLDAGELAPEDFSFKALFEELVDLPVSYDNMQTLAESVHTSAFPIISQKIIHKKIISEYELQSERAASLVREGDANGRTDKELVAGIAAGDFTPLLRPQYEAYEETSFGEKDYTINMADFGRLISLSREMIYEDRSGEVMTRSREIGRAAGQHRSKMIIQTVEGTARTAFDESAFQGCIYKGTAKTSANLYANDHATNFDGQTNDNLAASNALAEYTDLDNVMQLFAAMVDEEGQPIEIVPKQILIPTALNVTAYRIMNTTSYQYADGTTPKTTINPIAAIGNFDIVPSIYTANSTSWYMGDFPSQLLWVWVFRPATASQGAMSESAFTNQILARFRFAYHGGVGHTDYRYIVKSNA